MCGGGEGGGSSNGKGVATIKGWKQCPNVPATEANAKEYCKDITEPFLS